MYSMNTSIGTSIPSVFLDNVGTFPSSGIIPSGKGTLLPGSYATVALIFLVLGTLTRFEAILDEYFASSDISGYGQPTVQYCADNLCLSANYFSDMCRKETGMSALKHIQQKMLDVAKEKVPDTTKTISQVSYDLGFPYPQHFNRWFKKMTSMTPNEYRNTIMN